MKIKLVGLLLLIGLAVGCSSDDAVPVDTEVKRFIWTAMNQFYYWQSDVSELNDANAAVLNAFVDDYDTPEDLFQDVLFSQDRFSWMVSDFVALEESFEGFNEFGYNFGLVRINDDGDLLGYVRYVIDGGPAENVGLVRGDLFTEVNGQTLNLSNYVSLLFETSTITLKLTEIVDNALVATSEEVTMSAAPDFFENPIFMSSVIEVDGSKVGYLVYNSFILNNQYNTEMNNVIAQFNSEGIEDFILDLRYNSGGSLTSSRILSGMIYGNAGSEDVLGSIIYNEKLSDFNTDLTFLTEIPVFNDQGEQVSNSAMNRLNLNKIYVLTSSSTASASEFVIAGLLPFMDVTLIGDQTVGKNVGSITLYDSEDYLKSSSLNPNHTYAIQPIISQLANSEGFTDYIDGFTPDVQLREIDFLDDLKPLGDLSEPLLAEALSMITGSGRLSQKSNMNNSNMQPFKDVRLKQPTSTIRIDDSEIIKVIGKQVF
ncbi:S41 family peptidase [Ekhidna sp.]